MLPLIPLNDSSKRGHREDDVQVQKRAREELFFMRAMRNVGDGNFTNKLALVVERPEAREVRVDLNVEYKDGVPTRLFVEGSRSFGGEEELCLAVKFSADTGLLYIESLFNTATPHECDAWVVGAQQERSGIGKAVMRVVTSIADELFANNVTLLLTDASHFTAANTPILDVFMTEYLRLKRGFGYYEGLGFMSTDTKHRDTAAKEAERMKETVRWHDVVFDTPLVSMQDTFESEFPGDMNGMTSVAYKAHRSVLTSIANSEEQAGEEQAGEVMRLLGDLSLRGVLGLLEATANPLRPTTENDVDEVFKKRWRLSSRSSSGMRYLWRAILKGRDRRVDLALTLLDNLVFKYLVFKDSFSEATKTLFAGEGGHVHVLPREGVQKVPRGGFRIVGTDSDSVRSRFPGALSHIPSRGPPAAVDR